MIDSWLLDHLVCPVDHSTLTLDGEQLRSADGRTYPIVEGIPVMLVDSPKHTLWVAGASLNAARSTNNHTEDPLHLETIGVDPDQREGIRAAFAEGRQAVDPVVSHIISHTCGIAYKHLIGNLKEYPIPELPLPDGEGRHLLDIGCNWGRWCIASARRGYQPVGVDPSLGAVLAAKRVADQLGVKCLHVVADARFLPFKEESFNTVFSYSVLQHFSKPDASTTLTGAGRVLKSGGICKVQMPNFLGIRCLQHQLRRSFREPHGFEVRYWSLPELKRVFEESIGPSHVSVDCFFGLGLQSSDKPLMPTHLKAITELSGCLTGLSRVLAPLVWAADSVYVASTRS